MEYPEKNLLEQSIEPGFGNQTWSTLVVGECAYHCARPSSVTLILHFNANSGKSEATCESFFISSLILW